MIIDLHVHTNRYSKCSLLAPEEAILRAKERELDGICFMEHNNNWEKEEIRHLSEKYNFLVLRGMEIDTGYGHILVFGLDSYRKEMGNIDQLRAIVHREGGLMIAAHPFRTPIYPQGGYGDWRLNLPFEQGIKRKLFSLVDAIEVFNSRCKPEEGLLSLKISQFLHLNAVAGSDAHKVPEVGASVTVFTDNIKDEGDLIMALNKGNCYGVNLGY